MATNWTKWVAWKKTIKVIDPNNDGPKLPFGAVSDRVAG
jgi:hypothetical protein